MAYFTEIEDYKTYSGNDSDFHFNYNANSGGGQSFLSGKFRDKAGNLVQPVSLNGCSCLLRFVFKDGDGVPRSVLLEDKSVRYEVKPRADGDSNMKLSVGRKVTPNLAVAAFLMLPETCGVKKAEDCGISILSRKNYWLQSMWLTVDMPKEGFAIFTPRDCVFGGGINKDGHGTARYFVVNVEKRLADIVQTAGSGKLDGEIASFLKMFADIYTGQRPFVYAETSTAITNAMKYLSNKFPERFSGVLDPLPFILELANQGNSAVQVSDGQSEDVLTSALRLFRVRRTDSDWATDESSGMLAYYAVNKGIRRYFSKFTSEKLANLSAEELQELFCGVQKDGKFIFEPMWSGKLGQGWPHIKKSYDKNAKEVQGYLSGLFKDASCAKTFAKKDAMRPGGFGGSVVSELLMKFHPESCFKYGAKTYKAFEALGLADFVGHANFDEQEYSHVCEIAARIKNAMLAMGFSQMLDNELPPDFLVVNEFLDWVILHDDEIAKIHEQKDELPKHVDMLSVALKLFASMRYEEEWQKNAVKDSFLNVYEFDKMTAEQYAAMPTETFKSEVMDKVWAFQNGGARTWRQLDDGEKAAYQKFVAEMRSGLKPFEAYFPPDKKCPRGMGVGIVSELLMRFYPTTCCSYNRDLIWDALVMLRLAEGDFEWTNKASVYQDFMGKCATVLRRMEAMKFARSPKTGDGDPPDYITVNEFLWFVHDNKNLIKEKAMAEKMKKDKPTKHAGNRTPLTFTAGSKDDELLLRLLAALRAKPFAILAGHSGTGRSRYVKKLAYMTCNADELRKPGELPGNYLLLQVKPNWHDSTDLLGFRNAMDGNRYQKTALIEFLFRAYHFKDTPFFLCLDEMNLAPVEQYFAEFLSAMESEEPVPLDDITADEDNLFELGCEWEDARDCLKAKKFSIPKNLFIVGTVNMDETTCQFSRKVLDRAFTLEMTDVDFTKFDGSSCKPPSYDDTIEEAKIQELLKGAFCADKLDEEDRDKDSSLIKVQKALEPTAFAIAYRFASEYTLLKRAFEIFDPDKKMGLDALDQAVLMKVLPRIAGEADYVEKVYGGKESEGLRGALAGKTVSLAKIATILKRAKEANAQYITFWP